jgi:hypothetical protein
VFGTDGGDSIGLEQMHIFLVATRTHTIDTQRKAKVAMAPSSVRTA